MKILFLTPQSPIPPDNGIRLRMARTLEVLSSYGEITLLCLDAPPQEGGLRQGALRFCRDVVFVAADGTEVRASGLRRMLQGLRNQFFDPRPYATRHFDGSDWRREFHKLQPQQFDLIWVQSLGLYGQLRPYSLPRVVVDLPDAESLRMRRELAENGWGARRFLATLDFLKQRRAEACWGAPDHWFVACSENDRRALGRRDSRCWIVRNAVALPEEAAEAGNGRTLLFIGTLAYKPNREATLFFAREVFPLILPHCPQAQLCIVGSAPSDEICALANMANVQVTGRVEFVEPYLRECAVMIVPLLNGCGTRLKVLEALAYGKAVVSTSIGAEGLPVRHGTHLLLADAPQDFAACCCQLLNDSELGTRLGRAGRKLVAESFSARHSDQDIREFLRESFGIPVPVAETAGVD